MRKPIAAVGLLALLAMGMQWMPLARAQEDDEKPTFKVKVDLVVLSFTVTDNKGRYVTGLKPSDFKITEDGIEQKLVTFGEGNKPPVVRSVRKLTASGRWPA